MPKKRNRHFPRCEPTKYATLRNSWSLLVENCSVHYALQLCRMTDDAIRTLQTDRDNFVLLLTDAARYMTAAGRVVKQTYPRLFHITCVAHGLHNAAERIRANYEDVDKLIAAVKASVVKNKDRRVKFSTINSPLQPVVTRWGSWLTAAEYYAKNFPQVCEIVNAFEGTGHLVVKAKEAIAAESLPRSLREICQCYTKLVD